MCGPLRVPYIICEYYNQAKLINELSMIALITCDTFFIQMCRVVGYCRCFIKLLFPSWYICDAYCARTVGLSQAMRPIRYTLTNQRSRSYNIIQDNITFQRRIGFLQRRSTSLPQVVDITPFFTASTSSLVKI